MLLATRNTESQDLTATCFTATTRCGSQSTLNGHAQRALRVKKEPIDPVGTKQDLSRIVSQNWLIVMCLSRPLWEAGWWVKWQDTHWYVNGPSPAHATLAQAGATRAAAHHKRKRPRARFQGVRSAFFTAARRKAGCVSLTPRVVSGPDVCIHALLSEGKGGPVHGDCSPSSWNGGTMQEGNNCAWEANAPSHKDK